MAPPLGTPSGGLLDPGEAKLGCSTSMAQGPHPKAVRADPDDPLIGSLVDGRYHVQGRLGAGGMGRVYLASDESADRRVALKVLPVSPADAGDPDFAVRFVHEAAMASGLHHPHVVEIYETGRCSQGGLYFAMEYLEGRTLASVLQQGPLPPERVIRIASQIARAVAEVHRMGWVHRDLKPSNVMLLNRKGEPDFVKVLDFGLARLLDPLDADLTHTGSFQGSPHYMAPEQARSERTTPAADIYSLGAIAYEMVCGRLPYRGDSPIAVLLEQQRQDPKRPRLVDATIPLCLEKVILKAMERDPARRYRTMDEVVHALDDAAGTLGVPAQPQPLTLLTAEDLARIEVRPDRGVWPYVLGAAVVAGIGAAAWNFLG